MNDKIKEHVTRTWEMAIDRDKAQAAFVKQTGNTVRLAVESRFPVGPLSSTSLLLSTKEFNELVDSMVFIRSEIEKAVK